MNDMTSKNWCGPWGIACRVKRLLTGTPFKFWRACKAHDEYYIANEGPRRLGDVILLGTMAAQYDSPWWGVLFFALCRWFGWAMWYLIRFRKWRLARAAEKEARD